MAVAYKYTKYIYIGVSIKFPLHSDWLTEQFGFGAVGSEKTEIR